MKILDAGLIPLQLATNPIGFLDAPPYEREEAKNNSALNLLQKLALTWLPSLISFRLVIDYLLSFLWPKTSFQRKIIRQFFLIPCINVIACPDDG